MKQILQDLTKGNTLIKEAPLPRVDKNSLLIAAKVSLISAGTERMLVDFGKASYLQKARQQPEKVKMVLEKIKTDGLLTTMDAVKSKLAEPLPLGYSHVGEVLALGQDVKGFQVGDRVVSNGPHADVVCVGKHLCAKIPDNVDDEDAAFTVLASIGLQGLRLASPTLGESFAVIGVGLIGLLVVQLLQAQGCRVLAIDFDESKLALARDFGAETCNPGLNQDPVEMGLKFSRGHGVDGVIITAATSSSEPVKQAANMSRKRGRIILVGVTGLELNRADFYTKELSFQVSCSYGPGRYEPTYEKEGLDYPIGFVRWTEERNFIAILDLMSQGALKLKPLISKKLAFEEAPTAYEALTSDRAALGILLLYNSAPDSRLATEVILDEKPCYHPSKPLLGVLGAGNYAARVLLPAFKKAGAQWAAITTQGGLSAALQGKKLGFAKACSDAQVIFADPSINTVIIATQHNTHASLVIRALKAGKHVFVEKPLALTLEDLASVESAYHTVALQGKDLKLMLGFNRRFSPQVKKMHSLLQGVHEPKVFIVTVNAGAIPADHWTQDPRVGGGRIIGEACHFIDLLRHLANSPIVELKTLGLGGDNLGDKASLSLSFADGSIGSIHYLANGASGFPKERIEVFAAGRILQLDNFRQLKGFGWANFSKMSLWRQDKGQDACVHAFLQSIEKGLPNPIPLNEVFEVARLSIQAAEGLGKA